MLVRKHVFLDDEAVDELHSYLYGRNFSLAMRVALELLLQRLREGERIIDIMPSDDGWDMEHPASPMVNRGS